MAEGMLPQIPVALKSRFYRVVERFTSELGRCPVKPAMPLIDNCWRWLQFDKEVINSHPSPSLACSMLLYKYSFCRARSLPNVRGTYPLSILSARWSSWSDVRLESEVGMVPVNWFVKRLRNLMLGNLLPISVEMLPLSMFH